MITIQLEFTNCRDEIVFNYYISELEECCAQEISGRINYKANTCSISISVENEIEFLKKFRETNSCDFSDLRHRL